MKADLSMIVMEEEDKDFRTIWIVMLLLESYYRLNIL
jgi:hypothetical protein